MFHDAEGITEIEVPDFPPRGIGQTMIQEFMEHTNVFCTHKTTFYAHQDGENHSKAYVFLYCFA